MMGYLSTNRLWGRFFKLCKLLADGLLEVRLARLEQAICIASNNLVGHILVRCLVGWLVLFDGVMPF